MKRLQHQTQVDALLEEKVVVLFKHSTQCAISDTAYEDVSSFESKNPDVPVYLIDVIEDRPLAQYVTERVGVAHESPQLILLQEGRVVWHASHFDLAGEALDQQIRKTLKEY